MLKRKTTLAGRQDTAVLSLHPFLPSQHIASPRMPLCGQHLVQPPHRLRNASLVAALLRHSDRLPERQRRELKVSESDKITIGE